MHVSAQVRVWRGRGGGAEGESERRTRSRSPEVAVSDVAALAAVRAADAPHEARLRPALHSQPLQGLPRRALQTGSLPFSLTV